MTNIGASYDAIVLDIMLPGLTGFEVCARLREAASTGALGGNQFVVTLPAQ